MKQLFENLQLTDSITESISFIEDIVGIPLKLSDFTNEFSSSVNIILDEDTNQKRDIINSIVKWVVTEDKDPDDWIQTSVDTIHVKCPIISEGLHNGEFIQLNIVIGNLELLEWSLRSERGKYKEEHRNIILRSIAESKGLDYDYRHGLRVGNQIITKPKLIEQILLPTANSKDFICVENLLKFIYKNIKKADIGNYIAEAYETLAKEHNILLPLPGDNIDEDLAMPHNNDTDTYFLARLRDRMIEQDYSMIIEDDKK